MLTEKTITETNLRFTDNNELLHLSRSNDENKAKSAMEQLIELNSGLVKSIAVKFLNRGIEFEDLLQIGMLGLMKAIDGFDEDKGFAFSTYATPVIAGEIKRQIRDTGLIKVSRIYKRNAAILLRERSIILENEGREPGIEELASRCGIEVAEAAAALDSAMPVISLNSEKYDDSDISMMDMLENESENDQMNLMLDTIALSQEIESLPSLWRKIVILRYYRGKTQCQCAELLGLTQVKISREERKALDFLKTKL